jgi:glycosyltransferase involved in cell wall biosynthesis
VFGEILKVSSIKRSPVFFSKVISEATMILSCSNHCAKSIKLINPQQSVTSLTYGIDTSHFFPSDHIAFSLQHLQRSTPTVLFVGRLSREMGLDSFIECSLQVMESHPNSQFIIAGQDSDCTQLAIDVTNRHPDNFHVATNISFSLLPDYYRLATLVVVPTRGLRTCSSLAAMEAMSTQKAVVAFDVGGIPEIIDHNVNGLLVPSDDVTALAASVCNLLNNDQLRDYLAANARKKALQYFEQKRVYSHLEELFSSLIDK